MSTTLTINVAGFQGGTAPGSFIRIDLQNCSNPRVIGTGQLVPQTYTVQPTNGIATITLYDNQQITCGLINVQGTCGCDADSQKTSFYSFSFVYQGEVTSIGSYNLRSGSFNLWDLTPCIGQDCICGNGSEGIPIQDQVPNGVIDSVNRTYTLYFKPKTLWLSKNGVYQSLGVDYTIVDNVITMTIPVDPGDIFQAKYIYGNCAPEITTETPVGAVNGINTVFTLAHPPQQNAIWLYVGGIYMTNGSDYTLNGNTITLFSAPLTNAVITADYVWGGSTYNTIRTEVPVGAINGSNHIFTISSIPGFLAIQHNTEWLIPGVGYTQNGMTLNFATAPSPGDHLFATLFS